MNDESKVSCDVDDEDKDVGQNRHDGDGRRIDVTEKQQLIDVGIASKSLSLMVKIIMMTQAIYLRKRVKYDCNKCT